MRRDSKLVCSFLSIRNSILSSLEDTMMPGASECELSKGESCLQIGLLKFQTRILISVTNEITEEKISLRCLVSQPINSRERASQNTSKDSNRKPWNGTDSSPCLYCQRVQRNKRLLLVEGSIRALSSGHSPGHWWDTSACSQGSWAQRVPWGRMGLGGQRGTTAPVLSLAADRPGNTSPFHLIVFTTDEQQAFRPV